jgi:hypothetical protein
MFYRTPGAWGAGSGADGTAAQIDGNFWELQQAINVLQAGGDPPNSISNIASPTGTTLVITMSGGGSFTFAMPVAAFRWRGAYATTAYVRNDLIAVAGEGVYLVLKDHSTALVPVFDPALLVAAEPAYQLLWAINVPAPIRTLAAASFTPAVEDANCYFRITHAGDTAITLPDTLPNGTELHFNLKAVGIVTFNVAFGLTLDQTTGFLNRLTRRGGAVTAKYIADAAVWDLFGDLAPVT